MSLKRTLSTSGFRSFLPRERRRGIRNNNNNNNNKYVAVARQSEKSKEVKATVRGCYRTRHQPPGQSVKSKKQERRKKKHIAIRGFRESILFRRAKSSTSTYFLEKFQAWKQGEMYGHFLCCFVLIHNGLASYITIQHRVPLFYFSLELVFVFQGVKCKCH